MPFTRADLSRLKGSATNHGRNPPEDWDDDNDSLMNGEGEDEEDHEEEDGDDNSGIFKKSLRMPPYEHAKRKLSQLIGMLQN